MSYKLDIKIEDIKDGAHIVSLSLYDEETDMLSIKLKAVYSGGCKTHTDKVKVYTKKLFNLTILDNSCLIDFIGDSVYDFISQLGYVNSVSFKTYTYSDSFAEKVERSILRHLEGEE